MSVFSIVLFKLNKIKINIKNVIERLKYSDIHSTVIYTESESGFLSNLAKSLVTRSHCIDSMRKCVIHSEE